MIDASSPLHSACLSQLNQQLTSLPKKLTAKQLTLQEHAQGYDIHLHLDFPLGPFESEWHQKASEILASIFSATQKTFTLIFTPHLLTHKVQGILSPHPQIKNIIAIGSGKGGVGKSTVALHLALAAHRFGARVGILDADIYGPSIPTLLGTTHLNPELRPDKKLEPIHAHGLQTISIGNLVDLDTAMIWRGPMVSQALQQLLNDTAWNELDYLFVDLPPGTGDIQLTLAQKVPLAGAVIITTPQDLALVDAHRAIQMFKKVQVPIIGLIENMSTFVCPHCSQETAIFGHQGGIRLATDDHVPFLGELPLNMALRTPIDDVSFFYPQLNRLAYHLFMEVARLEKSYSHHFGGSSIPVKHSP